MENPRYRNYFLGKLDPVQLEALELEIISRSDPEEELQIAESELVEDYLEGNLDSVDKKAFEQNYLVTAERQKQVEVVRQLKIYSQNNQPPESQPSFFEQLKSFFSWRPMLVATAGLLLMAAIGWVLFYSAQGNSELIALNRNDLSNLEEFKELTTLSLTSLNLRAGGNLKTVNQNSLSDRLFLRLLLPARIESPQALTVKILQGGKVLHTLRQNIYQNQEIRLLLPKDVLSRGEYQITVENGAEKYNYFFAVQ